MKIKVKKCVGVGCVWLNLEKKKRIKMIKVKKCVGVGYVAECVEESREREKERRQKVKGWLLWLWAVWLNVWRKVEKKKKKEDKR